MKKTKLEKVLEFIVNGESRLASEMLHEHIIAEAREIYNDISEEDNIAEDELELDDLDESYYEDDRSGDFEDDIETMSGEIETEEYFGEDDDMEDDVEIDDAFTDLEDEMDTDVEMSGEIEDMSDEVVDGVDGDVNDAMVNVEDALDELKAVFAGLMGDDMDDEFADEVADEFTDETDDEFADETEIDDMEDMGDELEESAELKAQSVTMTCGGDGKKSPVKQDVKTSIESGKAVDFASSTDEKGGKAPTAKTMNVTGPQDQGGKFNKSVKKPANKSEKAKSNIGS